MIQIPTFYVPSFYGDIKLKRLDDDLTLVIAERVTPAEREALNALAKRAAQDGWIDDIFSFKPEGETELKCSIVEAQAVIARTIKPGRDIVSVVRFSDNRMEELRAPALAGVPVSTPDPTIAEDESPAEGAPSGEPVATPAPTKGRKPHKDKGVAAKAVDAVKGAVGAAVAVPAQGCPLPAFEQAEVKARRVLEAFLDDEQIEDFRKQNAFVTTGGLTGHRYMVISRNNQRLLNRFGGRQVYDLDDKMPFCVHDWIVPSAEEMLTLHVMLSLPDRENYMRHLEH